MATAYDVVQQAYAELGNDSQKYWAWYFQDNNPYCENTIFSRQACFVSWLLTKCAVVCPKFPRASIDDLLDSSIDGHRCVDPMFVTVGDVIIFGHDVGIVTWVDDGGGLWLISPSVFDGLVSEFYMGSKNSIKYCFRPYYRNKV